MKKTTTPDKDFNREEYNKNLDEIKRESKVKHLMSVNSTMNVILGNSKQVDFFKVQGKEIV